MHRVANLRVILRYVVNALALRNDQPDLNPQLIAQANFPLNSANARN